MLKFRPSRLRDRIGLIVVLHLAMMIGVIYVFIQGTDARKMAPLYRLPDPQKVALVTTAFEHAPPETHSGLVAAFSDASQRVQLLDALPSPMAGAATGDTMDRYRDALGGRPFRVLVFGDRAPVSFDSRLGLSAVAVRVAVALPDGHALAIEQKVVAPIAKIFDRLLLFLLAVGLVNIVVILWLSAQTTRPVERLARAVREDGLDDLKPEGPREIVELAGSFRQLRGRLRDLLDERTRMLAAIAHDYRTYLTRLQLRSEFIEDEGQRALAVADLDEMQQLLDDTLTFARESVAGEMDGATCDLRAELDVIATQRRERGEDVAFPALEEAIMVRASHVSFQRMTANLLDNALRYGGGRAQLRIVADRSLVRVYVEDEGPGVPELSLGRLLEPFQRLESSRARHTGGVGLGLSIVQALARRYDGDLALENRKERRGFRATLTLRRAHRER